MAGTVKPVFSSRPCPFIKPHSYIPVRRTIELLGPFYVIMPLIRTLEPYSAHAAVFYDH